MSEHTPESQLPRPSLFERPVTFLWQEGDFVWLPGSAEDDAYLDATARRERLAGLLAGIPGVVAVGGTLSLLILRSQPDTGVFAVLAGALIGLPYLLYSMRPGPWGVWRKQLMSRANRSNEPATRRSVTLRPDGITYETDVATVNYRWNAFEDVRRLPGHISLDWADLKGAILIPIGAFDTDDDADHWCAAAKGALEHSDYGQAGRTKAFLSTYPINCGKCGQSLRGLREQRCPECGETFSTYRLKLWHTLRFPLWRLVLARLGIHPGQTRRARRA
ncbi:MAG: hypothetical protein GC200_01110 [Tepidisphaera sp.]|nr:hypothetical protein [Tepidisphaera sp.]